VIVVQHGKPLVAVDRVIRRPAAAGEILAAVERTDMGSVPI
jgi:hypothetical protein